jgi:predicted nucleic acid-binding protein
MIVLDASVVVDLLLDLRPSSDAIADRLSHERTLAAPHLLDVEVAQVLRRLVQAGKLDAARAESAVVDLMDMPVRRYPLTPLLERVFALRENVTAYDAAYLVLAEELGAVLLTRDEALCQVPGCGATVEMIPSS